MAKLVSVEAASELIGSSKNSLFVTASQYKMKNGKYPKWYISNGERGASKSYIDMEVLDKNRQLVRSMWMYSTDSFYWIMSEEFKMSDSYIAHQLAKRSDKFKAVDSWKTFLNHVLFRLPPDSVYALGSDMHTEFFLISKRIIALANRKS